MVFGDVGVERLQINDDTLWSGGPAHWDRRAPGRVRGGAAPRRSPATTRRPTAGARTDGAFTQSYLPLGDVWLTFEHGNLGRDYRRELHLADAVASVALPGRRRPLHARGDRECTGRCHRRADRRESARAGHLRRRASPARCTTPSPSRTACCGCAARRRPTSSRATTQRRAGALRPRRRRPGRAVGRRARRRSRKGRRTLPGMRFEMGVASSPTAARVSSRVRRGLRVENADAVTLMLATATGFNGFDKDPARDGRDPARSSCGSCRPPRARRGPRCATAHVADHRALFDRLTLELPAAPGRGRPTDRRIATRGGTDPGLVELLLPVRPLPADRVAAGPARSRPTCRASGTTTCGRRGARNYTININTQMNYWPAESANLAELHEPLLAFIRELAVTGARTAASTYGARGWTAHHNSDIWRHSAMVGDFGDGDPVWATWPMAGAVAGAAPLRALPVRRRPRLAARPRVSGAARRRASSASTGWSTTARATSSPRRRRRPRTGSAPAASTARSAPARRWIWR